MCDMAISQHSQSKQMLLELRISERHRSGEVELKSIVYRITSFHEHGILATIASDCKADTEAND